jgi:lysophospholipase L1-like esterase
LELRDTAHAFDTSVFTYIELTYSLVLALMLGLTQEQPRANLNLPLRILPLGDSITWGGQPGQDNGTNGYRAQLIHALIRARYASVDFVGTQRSGLMYNNANEGHPGATISQLRGVMKAGLQMRPNVILLHIGTNDLARPESTEEKWKDAPKRLASLLDDVLDMCPDAAVLVAKLIQGADPQAMARIQAFNDAIPAIVETKLKQGFKVAVVDHSVVTPDELVDGLHP